MTVDDLAGVRTEQLRDALRLLGRPPTADVPANRPRTGRALRELLQEPGVVRGALAEAPEGARQAFVTLATEGPTSVESLLGRGWWGRGVLPPPLDWLQQRALVVVDDAGLVRAVSAAVHGWRAQQLEIGETPEPDQPRLDETPEAGHPRLADVDGRAEELLGPQPVAVERASSVVVAERAEDLDRVLAVPAAGLRAVAATVAISRLGPDALSEALRAAGAPLRSDAQVRARPDAPALPFNAERAVTPWDLRSLFTRALGEQRQVHLVYYPSSRGGAATERTVDPWSFADDLLTGYCHLRAGERTFALDRVGQATLLPSHLEHRPPPP